MTIRSAIYPKRLMCLAGLFTLGQIIASPAIAQNTTVYELIPEFEDSEIEPNCEIIDCPPDYDDLEVYPPATREVPCLYSDCNFPIEFWPGALTEEDFNRVSPTYNSTYNQY